MSDFVLKVCLEKRMDGQEELRVYKAAETKGELRPVLLVVRLVDKSRASLMVNIVSPLPRKAGEDDRVSQISSA